MCMGLVITLETGNPSDINVFWCLQHSLLKKLDCTLVVKDDIPQPVPRWYLGGFELEPRFSLHGDITWWCGKTRRAYQALRLRTVRYMRGSGSIKLREAVRHVDSPHATGDLLDDSGCIISQSP